MTGHRGHPSIVLPPGATLISGGKDRPPKCVKRVVVRSGGAVTFYEGYARTKHDWRNLRRFNDPNQVIGFYRAIGYQVVTATKRRVVLEKAS